MQLLPARLRGATKLAAVDSMDRTSGLGVIPHNVTYTADQQRAMQYATKLGFVNRAHRFVAWQSARCPLRVETGYGPEWAPVHYDTDPKAWVALNAIHGKRTSPADLIRTGVYLDDTAGEAYIVQDSAGDGVNPPYFSVRSPESVTPTVGVFGGRRVPGFLVADAPGGTATKGTATFHPAAHVHRHWQASERYELMATSSLIGMLDELDHYWTIIRTIRRRARNRIAVNGFIWTPAEAHTETHLDASGNISSVSQLEWEYAHAASKAINDLDDREVASVAPQILKTPGAFGAPAFIDIPGLTAEELAHLQDARMAVADSLPLATSSVLSEAAGNHWNEWLASEADAELIADRLGRFTASLTRAVYRPMLRVMAEAGIWDGDPDAYRVGFDLDPIRRRPDNSVNAQLALDSGAIGWRAYRREMHFSEDDAPSPSEVEQIVAMSVMRASRIGANGTPPVGVTQAPPTEPVPTPPAALTAATLPVIDDRWVLLRNDIIDDLTTAE